MVKGCFFLRILNFFNDAFFFIIISGLTLTMVFLTLKKIIIIILIQY